MKTQRILSIVFAILFSFAAIFKVTAQPADSAIVKPNSHDHSHDYQPLPDGILAWHTLSQTAVVMEGESFAHFTFNFTNISLSSVTILNVDPTCGCTTAELPSAPWAIPAGSNGEIKARVDLTNKIGRFTEYIKVITNKGSMNLALCIDIQPKPASQMTGARRAAGIVVAKLDRQAFSRKNVVAIILRTSKINTVGNFLLPPVSFVARPIPVPL